jgi:hypothetical protein
LESTSAGCTADGVMGAAAAPVIENPAPMATATAAESRTLRIRFLSLGWLERDR